MTSSTDDLARYRVLAGLSTTDETQDDAILVYLNIAEKRVLNTRYPFGYESSEEAECLDKYSTVVDSIFQYRWNRQGAEGECTHNENGINRAYIDEDVLLRDVTPIAMVV